MKLVFLGSGSAFTMQNRQSNMMVEINGRKLLIDAGSDIRFSLKLMGYTFKDVNELYISHLHDDHCGGMEWLGFITYFTPGVDRPKLHLSKNLVAPLWNTCLSGGMASLQGQIATLDTYYNVNPVEANGGFTFEETFFQLVQTIHIMDGFSFSPSYGLIFKASDGRRVYLTTDTQFCPNQIMDFYKMSDVIFQDCETSPFKSGVHAHYTDLKTLPPEIRARMWLYHFNDGELPDAVADGFAGFVEKGQCFDL